MATKFWERSETYGSEWLAYEAAKRLKTQHPGAEVRVEFSWEHNEWTVIFKRKKHKGTAIMLALFLCIGGTYMADREAFAFDMGNPLEQEQAKKQPAQFKFSQQEVLEILKTIPQETLDNYGVDLSDIENTPEESIKEGKVYALKLAANGNGLTTRMTREGYTITDHADYYWFDHGKWSSRGGKTPAFIIPHHMAGNLTPAQFYAIEASSRQMSATISIHTDGTVYAWVPEEMRPWTTGSYQADQDALTMEIANDEIGGDWHISDTAYDMAVAIAAEWCKRYDIDPYWKPGAMGTIQEHKQWASTSCPGPYLSRKIESGQFEADVRAAMNPKPPTPTPSKAHYRVQCGAFAKESNARTYQKMIETKAKINTLIRFEGGLYKVQCGAFGKKENAEAMAAKLKANGFQAIIKEI